MLDSQQIDSRGTDGGENKMRDEMVGEGIARMLNMGEDPTDAIISERESLTSQIQQERGLADQLATALKTRDCNCKCAAHESDWPQSPHFKVCLFLKRLRQSGEPLSGPGEVACEKVTCARCAALAQHAALRRSANGSASSEDPSAETAAK